ncbi:hypothetical protein [Paraburkholderia sp. SIMBA_054]
MNQQIIKPAKTPVREIVSMEPLRSVVYLNGCKLTEVMIDGAWVCVHVE